MQKGRWNGSSGQPLPSQWEDLSSNPSAAKKKKKAQCTESCCPPLCVSVSMAVPGGAPAQGHLRCFRAPVSPQTICNVLLQYADIISKDFASHCSKEKEKVVTCRRPVLSPPHPHP
jgi:hypothetical protein